MVYTVFMGDNDMCKLRLHTINVSVRNVANKSTNSDMAIIPGGLTGHIQPADVSWN